MTMTRTNGPAPGLSAPVVRSVPLDKEEGTPIASTADLVRLRGEPVPLLPVTRSVIALILVVTVASVAVLAIFALLWSGRPAEEIRVVVRDVLEALVPLTATAVGFFFGEQSARANRRRRPQQPPASGD